MWILLVGTLLASDIQEFAEDSPSGRHCGSFGHSGRAQVRDNIKCCHCGKRGLPQ